MSRLTILTLAALLASASPALGQSMTILNPSGVMPKSGSTSVGASYQSNTRGTNNSDGEAFITTSPTDFLELGYTIDSFGRSSSFGSGGFSAKAGIKVAPNTYIATGWNQFATIGSASRVTDVPEQSWYVSGTRMLSPDLAVTAGFGSGQFSTNGDSSIGGFGTVAYKFHPNTSAIVEYTGQDLAVALSHKYERVTLNLGFRDLENSPRFVLSSSYRF